LPSLAAFLDSLPSLDFMAAAPVVPGLSFFVHCCWPSAVAGADVAAGNWFASKS